METRKNIIVTGSGGQLGEEFKELAVDFPLFNFIFLSKEDLPIFDFERARNLFDEYRPDYCINCAAYTAVDHAETDKKLAFLVNAEGVGVLAELCKLYHTHFIHFSTDYVFDGKAKEPYTERSPVRPVNVYGESKLAGETKSFSINPDSIVIRTAWVYSEFGKNFVKTILRLLKEKEEINVVNDQFGSPTYAADIAAATMEIITSGHWQPGIYHFTNEGIISWFDFAVVIKELTGSSCRIKPVSTSEYPTTAKRPTYTVMDKTRVQQVYHIVMKNWKESLSRCLSRLK